MKKKNINLYISLCISFIVLIILYGIYNFYMNRDYVELDNKNLDLVYESYNKNNIRLPGVNLIGEDIEVINKDIKDFTNTYIDNNKDSNLLNIDYLYSRSGKILSIVIICTNSDTIGSPDMMFRTYNINLVDNTIISDKELLKHFNYSEKDITNSINSYFKDYYDNSSLKDNGCNYDCYINDKNTYYNGLDDLSYYVKKNRLYVYMNMNEKMDYMENNYYSKNNYIFLIK